MLPSESQEQITVVRWFDLSHRDLKGRLIAVPNGAHLAGSGKQRAAKMARMKAEGLRPGFPDLFLPVPAHGFQTHPPSPCLTYLAPTAGGCRALPRCRSM